MRGYKGSVKEERKWFRNRNDRGRMNWLIKYNN